MTLGTEIGETSYNMLTIYPIQSNHCGKGLLMMNTLWPHSRIVYDLLRNTATTYTHNYGCREPSKSMFIHTRGCATKRFAKFGMQKRTFCGKKRGKNC